MSPYIDQANVPEALYDPKNPGELNAALSDLAYTFLRRHTGGRYEDMNAVMGVFVSAALEFYRRVMVPYEDAKRADPANFDPYKRDDDVTTT